MGAVFFAHLDLCSDFWNQTSSASARGGTRPRSRLILFFLKIEIMLVRGFFLSPLAHPLMYLNKMVSPYDEIPF